MQVKAFGGLPEATKARLREIATGASDGTLDAATMGPRIKPGTKLVRTWHGETHNVLVLENGFSWKGQHHSSLTAIAKAITGTSWNGWACSDSRTLTGNKMPPLRHVSSGRDVAGGRGRMRHCQRARLRGKPRMGEHAKQLRCAIYTRKSSEEGLEQDFNSL